MAAAARRPMPNPAPRTASPAPRPAARYPSENWFMVQPPTAMNALSLGGEEWHVVAGYGPEAARSPARDAARTSVRVLRHPDEERREHGEHVGLHQRDEDLEHEDAQRERHAQRRDVHGDEQRQRDQEEDHDVAGHHVGEEADGEREGL